MRHSPLFYSRTLEILHYLYQESLTRTIHRNNFFWLPHSELFPVRGIHHQHGVDIFKKLSNNLLHNMKVYWRYQWKKTRFIWVGKILTSTSSSRTGFLKFEKQTISRFFYIITLWFPIPIQFFLGVSNFCNYVCDKVISSISILWQTEEDWSTPIHLQFSFKSKSVRSSKTQNLIIQVKEHELV